MANFEEEYLKRLRRVCGETDDTMHVTIREDLDEGNPTRYTCDPDDHGTFDFGPSYKITVYVHPENSTYWGKESVSRSFDGIGELMTELDSINVD